MIVKKKFFVITLSIPILFIITYFGFYHINLDFYLGNGNHSSNSLMANDAYKYYGVLRSFDSVDLGLILLNNKNLIPPTIPLYIMNGNLFLIYTFLFSSLIHSIIILSKYCENYFFLLFLLFSPIVISNLFPASKEITAYISGIYFLIYLLNKSKKFMFYSIFFAVLTRFELILVLLLIYSVLNLPFLKRNIKRVFIFVLLSLSILLPVLNLARGTNHIEETSATSALGLSAIYELFISNGFYFIIYPIKFLHNLFESGLVPVFSSLGAFFTFCSSLLFLFLFIILIKNKSYKSNDYELMYSVLFYGSIFCAGGFVQHRYFVFLYPIFLYMAFEKYILKQYKYNN